MSQHKPARPQRPAPIIRAKTIDGQGIGDHGR